MNKSRKENKKILFLTHLPIITEKERLTGNQSLVNTLKGYLKNGYDVYFVTSYHVCNLKIENYNNLKVIKLFPIFELLKNNNKIINAIIHKLRIILFYLISFVYCSYLIKKIKPSLLYGYEIFGAPIVSLLGRFHKIPVVTRFMGTILYQYLSSPFALFTRYEHVVGLRSKSDLVIMANDGTQGDKVLKRLSVDMSKVRFWMNGLDTRIMERIKVSISAFKRKYGIGENDKVILSVSRLTNWKRVDRIINIIPDVIKEIKNIKFVIVGDGEERNRLEQMVTMMDVQKYVIFTGGIKYSEMKPFYQMADIFVSMYDISNVGNPLLEAMVNGCPIITLNVGDTGKMIKNGNNGILINFADIPYLGQSIIQLLKDDKLRKKLGYHAEKYA